MGTVEQVRVARRTGFCYGVREAIDHARTSAADGKETLTLGQTVHNEGVISDLRSRGIRTVDTLDMVEPGTSVVIRAHGVTPEVMETAQRRGLDVIDGTCSWVVQEHREVARLVEEGYTIVLLGTPNHPEVVGIMGYAPGRHPRGRGRGVGAHPADQAHGARQPEHPAALEVPEARGLHGQPCP